MFSQSIVAEIGDYGNIFAYPQSGKTGQLHIVFPLVISLHFLALNLKSLRKSVKVPKSMCEYIISLRGMALAIRAFKIL